MGILSVILDMGIGDSYPPIVHAFVVVCSFFFKINFLKKKFRSTMVSHYQNVKSVLDPTYRYIWCWLMHLLPLGQNTF